MFNVYSVGQLEKDSIEGFQNGGGGGFGVIKNSDELMQDQVQHLGISVLFLNTHSWSRSCFCIVKSWSWFFKFFGFLKIMNIFFVRQFYKICNVCELKRTQAVSIPDPTLLSQSKRTYALPRIRNQTTFLSVIFPFLFQV